MVVQNTVFQQSQQYRTRFGSRIWTLQGNVKVSDLFGPSKENTEVWNLCVTHETCNMLVSYFVGDCPSHQWLRSLTQVHEGHGEVDHLLPLLRYGQVTNGQVCPLQQATRSACQHVMTVTCTQWQHGGSCDLTLATSSFTRSSCLLLGTRLNSKLMPETLAISFSRSME